jgi:hypothetical protein
MISFQMLTKECFSADDISKSSKDYLSLTDEDKINFWMFRQGFFYGSSLIGGALV